MGKFLVTTLLVLFAFQAVLASNNAPGVCPHCLKVHADPKHSIPAKPAATFVIVEPAQKDLPTAPHLSTDVYYSPAVKVVRNPVQLKNVNSRPVNAPRPALMEVIPAGLRPFWNTVKAECSWFTAEESNVLMEFFEIIVNDRPEDFDAFQARFLETFGSGYGSFAKNDRSVLSWLISFGSVNILRSIDLNTYTIPQDLLDKSLRYFVERSSFRFVANAIVQCPFLVDLNIFKYVIELRNPTFHQLFTDENCFLNLACLFSEMRVIDITHIAALLPLMPADNEIFRLINASASIVTTLLNPHYNRAFSANSFKAETVPKFRAALSKFFELSLHDFSVLNLPQRFTVADLFIKTSNVVGLKRMLDMDGTIATTIGNSKTLLQVSISTPGVSMECVELLVSHNPKSVLQTVNNYQAPFLQAVQTNSIALFDIFYPVLTDNSPFLIHGSAKALSPIVVVMMQGDAEMLRKLVNHFDGKGIKIDLFSELDTAMTYLERRHINQFGNAKHRTVSFISSNIWSYLLDDAKIEVDSTRMGLSLLEYAIFDRNPEAVRRLLKDPRTQVNRIFQSVLGKGNCLLLLNADLTAMKLLVEAGVDINAPVEVASIDPVTNVTTTKPASMYSVLIRFHDPEFAAYLKTLNFTDKPKNDNNDMKDNPPIVTDK